MIAIVFIAELSRFAEAAISRLILANSMFVVESS
jgi:hypothetical protein